MGLKHFYKSLKSDPVDATLVGATKWNDDHYFLDPTGAPLGALGDLPYRGAGGLVTLLAGAQGVLYSAGAGQVPANTMNPTLAGVTWPSGHGFSGTSAAHVTDLFGGMNAQVLRVFDFVAGSGDYRYIGIFGNWSGNGPAIVSSGDASGLNTPLNLVAQTDIRLKPNVSAGGSGAWNITATGLMAAVDNAIDIGAAGATRPRNLYLGGNLTAGGTITATAFVVAGGGGETISGAEIAVLDGVIPGTVTASKAVVVDANKDITSFRNLTANAINVGTVAAATSVLTVGGALGNNVARIIVTPSNTARNFKISVNDQVGGALEIHRSTALGGVAFSGPPSWYWTSDGHFLAGTDNTYDIGATGATRPRSVYAATAVVVGTNPSSTGAIRLPNNQFIQARNAANSADQLLVGLGTSNETYIGSGGGGKVLPGSGGMHLGDTASYWASISVGGANAATVGAVRLPAVGAVNGRNAANSADYNLVSWGVIAADQLVVGAASYPTRLRSSLATPGTLGNGDWWVECTGTSPARVCAIKVQDGGATRTIATITY